MYICVQQIDELIKDRLRYIQLSLPFYKMQIVGSITTIEVLSGVVIAGKKVSSRVRQISVTGLMPINHMTPI